MQFTKARSTHIICNYDGTEPVSQFSVYCWSLKTYPLLWGYLINPKRPSSVVLRFDAPLAPELSKAIFKFWELITGGYGIKNGPEACLALEPMSCCKKSEKRQQIEKPESHKPWGIPSHVAQSPLKPQSTHGLRSAHIPVSGYTVTTRTWVRKKISISWWL